jgi:membrane protease YdiL (CAAX protease family)
MATPPPVPWRPLRAARVLRAYLLAAIVWLPFTIGYLRAMRGLGHPVPMQPQLATVSGLAVGDLRFWAFALAIAIGAPLAEELIFRGYLLGALQLVLPRCLANLLTACAFGAMHGLDYMLPMAVLGLVFGWLRQRHESMGPSILAHMVHNGLVLTVALIAPGALDWMYPQ